MILLAIVRYIFHRRDRELIMAGSVGVFVSLAISVRSNTQHKFYFTSWPKYCIEIRKPRSKPFLIITSYRSPNSSTEIFFQFETLVGKLVEENAEFSLFNEW